MAAVIEIVKGPNPYEFREGEFRHGPGGRFWAPYPKQLGGVAVEVNGRDDVPSGTFVVLHMLNNGTLVFQAP